MTKEEQQKLIKSLDEEKAVIEGELNKIAKINPVVKNDYQAIFPKVDQADTSDEKAHSVTDYEEERAIEQNLELRLKDINETLQKLSEGTYGYCSNCKTPIEEKRLKAMPVANLCFDCASNTGLAFAKSKV